MPISPYLAGLRARIGRDLLLMPAVAAVVRDDAGRVLIVRQADGGHWSLPAGAIEPGETPAEAAVREVREETGLDVRPEQILGVFGGRDGFRHTYPNGDRVEFTVVVFACAVTGGSLVAVDGEASALRFVPPGEALPLVPAYPAALLLDAGGPVLFQPLLVQAGPVQPPAP